MKKQNNNKRGGPRKPRNELISHPPQIDGFNLRHSTTLRYRATAAAVQTTITSQNLLDTILVATTAIAGSNLFQTVKIRRVRVWGMPAVGAASSVIVEFSGTNGALQGDQIQHSDTSMGVQPAHVDARPSSKALISNYQVGQASPVMTISCPAGSVIDLELSFRGYAPGAVAAGATNALVAATAGSVYFRGFDGLATATSNFVPEFTSGQI